MAPTAILELPSRRSKMRRQNCIFSNHAGDRFSTPSRLTLLAVGSRIWLATSVRGNSERLIFHPILDEVFRDVRFEQSVSHGHCLGCSEPQVLQTYITDPRRTPYLRPDSLHERQEKITMVTVTVQEHPRIDPPCAGQQGISFGCHHIVDAMGPRWTVLVAENNGTVIGGAIGLA